MKFKILFLLFLMCGLNYAQPYSVLSYAKINDTNGNYNTTLNDEDWFGYSVEGIGDLNNDGVDDIAVSSLKEDLGAFNTGSVTIMFLNADGSVQSSQKIGSNQGGFTGVLEEWDIFGTSLSYLGDLNNDGKIELGVGAEYDGDGGYRHGAIWIVSLNNDGTVFSHQKISSLEGGFLGVLDVWDVFGSDIAAVGDFNGDTITDIAVGARRDGDGGQESGAVWLLFLNTDFTVNGYQKISATSGNLNIGFDFQDYFGSSITNLGDLNGDGVIDLAVGAYRDDDGGIDKGAVYILFMALDGTVVSTQKISETFGNFTETLSQDQRFGRSTDLIGDINEDGKPELLVGCQNNFFYLLNLNSDGTVDNFEKYGSNLNSFSETLNDGDFFGFSVSNIGNVGGQQSIALGAFGDSENGFQKGAVWTFKLRRNALSIEEYDIRRNIKIYPNPTTDFFSISIKDYSDDYRVRIYDVNGRLVDQMRSNASNEYDISHLESGMYLIHVSLNNAFESTFQILKK